MTLRSRLAGWPRLRPTPAGWSLLALATILLLMAINEGNNLLYAFAFIIVSVWLVGAVQAWLNLHGVVALARHAAALAAGEWGPVEVRLRAQGRPRQGLCISLADDPAGRRLRPFTLALLQGNALCSLSWLAEQRGWQALPDLQLSSSHALGLAQATLSCPVQLRRLVWPRPAESAGPQPLGANALRAAQTQEFTGLSSFQRGDSARRLAWRALARGGTPQVKRFDGAQGAQALRIDWRTVEGDVETRLAQLARRVLDAERQRQPWQLLLPGLAAAPAGHGERLKQEALRSLALFEAR